jgi:hypothetical protein
MLSTVSRFNYTKYWGILYVEHHGKIYLHKIPRNIVYWALWEDLFTQNTEEYFMLNTVRRFVYTNYWGILLCWALCEDLFTQNTEEYFVEHCGKIYLHKILGNTLCWAQWEYWFTHNTGDYIMLNTVGKIYLHKILRDT